MQDLNLALLHWMAAGDEPQPWVLLLGIAFARYGAMSCALITAWAAWRRLGQWRYVVVCWLGAGVAAMLAHAIASRLGLPRPFMLCLTPAYIEHGASGSLPSAHACVMTLVALMFMQRAGLRHVGVPLLLLAVLTGWARIYVGVHFPMDILAGMLLAVALAGVFVALQRAIFQKLSQTRPGWTVGATGWERT